MRFQTLSYLLTGTLVSACGTKSTPSLVKPISNINSRVSDVGALPVLENTHELQVYGGHGSSLAALRVQNESQHNTEPFRHLEVRRGHTWTVQPRCMAGDNNNVGGTTEYCIFTNNDFANGRGISIFTTRERAQTFLRLRAFTGSESHFDAKDNSYAIVSQKIPGKGIGVVAKHELQRGDLIFSHTPLYIADEAVYGAFEEPKRHLMQELAIKRLPARSRHAYIKLMGHWGGDRINDILNTNSFVAQYDSASDTSFAVEFVVPEISRLNHDCRPNAHFHFDRQTFRHNVRALRPIQPEEEITISYIDPAQTFTNRQDALKEGWGFTCTCSLCQASAASSEVRHASDGRIIRTQELYNTLVSRTSLRKSSPEIAEQMIKLDLEEEMLGPIAQSYALAAIEHSKMGGEGSWKARNYARLALEAGALYQGSDFTFASDMNEILVVAH